MPSISRRGALRSTAGLLAALAGCSAETGSPSTPSERGPPEDALRNPSTVRLRNPNSAPVVTHGTPTPTVQEGRIWGHLLVTDTETANALTFADVDGVERARTFLKKTDFSTETVYVEQRELGECYTRRICWVRWTTASIETAYTTELRDADVACSADAIDVVATLIRLPAALDPDTITRYGSRGGSDYCRPRRTEAEESA